MHQGRGLSRREHRLSEDWFKRLKEVRCLPDEPPQHPPLEEIQADLVPMHPFTLGHHHTGSPFTDRVYTAFKGAVLAPPRPQASALFCAPPPAPTL